MQFKSVLRSDKVAYEISDGEDWAERGRSVVDKVREYPTYGDGMTKHGGSYKVQAENFVDCLLSLYDFLSSPVRGVENEAIKKIESTWPTGYFPGNDTIAFFAGLKFVEGKRRFFNAEDKKISSNPSKQYDKRWAEITYCHDGTLTATTALVKNHSYSHDAVCDFAVYLRISDWVESSGGWVDHDEHYGIGCKDDTWYDLKAAFNLVDALVTSYRQLSQAKRMRESIQHNMDNRILRESQAA